MTMDHVRCYMKQILNALVFAEERNIMHRDLKPANLLLSKDSHTIKFADWGMARKELNETKVETLITVRVIDGCFWLTRGLGTRTTLLLSLDYHCVCCAQRRMSLISHIQVMLDTLFYYLRTKIRKQLRSPNLQQWRSCAFR